MEWFIVLTLLIAGLALIIVEFIFIPGSTVVGILGFVFMLTGLFFAYNDLGTTTGHIITAISLIVIISGIYVSLKYKLYQRFSLRDTVKSSVKPMYDSKLHVGDKGVATSALRPSGEAVFDDHSYEVTTLGEFAATGQHVEVIQLRNNKILVKPITEET